MNTHYFHISLYDVAFFGAIFVGSAFAALLQSSKSINQIPNRFLGLALAVIVAWLLRMLGADIHLEIYLPYWSQLPYDFRWRWARSFIFMC